MTEYCPVCDGDGQLTLMNSIVTCPHCNNNKPRKCPECNGTGWSNGRRCWKCNKEVKR